MGAGARTGRPFVVGEPALVGVDVVAQPEVIEIAEHQIAGAGSEQFYPTRGKIALDQQLMKRFEECPGERMRLAPLCHEAECNSFMAAK